MSIPSTLSEQECADELPSNYSIEGEEYDLITGRFERDVDLLEANSLCRWYGKTKHPRSKFHEAVWYPGNGNRKHRSISTISGSTTV